MLSDVMEDYLKAIYRLQREGGGRVSTSDLAERLGVRPPTVTKMLGKLADRGLADYEKYEGVTLTDEGETVALEVLRHHRLLESYLTEHLDFDWAAVHDEADALEHHISEELEARIAAALDDPEVDPHGDPIPDADLTPIEETETVRLSDCTVGTVVEVERVSDRDAEELEYLAEAGIEPGRRLELREIAPIGMYVVAHEEGVQHLPEAVAETIRVRKATGSHEPAREVSGA